MVPPDSARIPRVPAYSGTVPSQALALRLRGFHPLCRAVPDPSAALALSYWPVAPAPPYNPMSKLMVWALPRSLAATGGISFDFSSCWYLDGSLPSVCLLHVIYWRAGDSHSRLSGYPIRRPGDRRLLAPTPGFSQLSASFIAWQLLGILDGPIFT